MNSAWRGTYISREEIDRIADDLRIKGRHPAAVIHLRREKGELQYRHATGELWHAVSVPNQAHPSGASSGPGARS